MAGAFFVDVLAVICALLLAQWIRFETLVSGFGVPVEDSFRAIYYIGHIVLGVGLMMATLTNFRLYARENLLSYTNTLKIIFKSSLVWILSYLALTLMYWACHNAVDTSRLARTSVEGCQSREQREKFAPKSSGRRLEP